MKNSELHDKSADLISAAMINICDNVEETTSRDINIDTFLRTLNNSLVQMCPQLAYDSGLARDPN